MDSTERAQWIQRQIPPPTEAAILQPLQEAALKQAQKIAEEQAAAMKAQQEAAKQQAELLAQQQQMYQSQQQQQQTVSILNIEINDENTALNVMVQFLTIAQKRGTFNIPESAKIYECLQLFTKKSSSSSSPPDNVLPVNSMNH